MITAISSGTLSAEGVFTSDIQPLLARRCYACHGPDTQEADLRLDDRAAATTELESGTTAIVPGDARASELVARITSTDPDLRMPPEGAALSAAEVDSLTRWINDGAAWEAHWAFRPLVRPLVPPAAEGKSPIDIFIEAGLTARELPPPELADKAALLRRVTYGVIGLPPSEQEMRDFIADESADATDRTSSHELASMGSP